MATSFEARYVQQGSLTDSDQGSIDEEDSAGSSSNLLESVQEQELQFSKLTREIEEEKRAVKRQLNMENYSGDQHSYSGSDSYHHPDVYITRSEEYGAPEEETSILIDDQGNQKTVKTRTVTKTVTEQRYHHVDNPDSNHMSPRSDLSEPQYATIDRNPNKLPNEGDGLLQGDSSSNQSDRLSYGEGDHRHPDSSVLSNSRYEDVRRATPEKFQPEGYGLEEDGRSDSGDETDQYGLEAPRSYQTGLKRGDGSSSVASQSDGSQRYEDDDGVDEPDEIPIAAPRSGVKDPLGRAPLAMQESGSRASLDALGDGWQVPTLEEVIRMLTYNMKVVQQNAAAYIQHLCFNNDPIKKKVRDLGGIPPLVRLLDHPELEVQLNACGALRNLSFGSNNDGNKIEIKKCEGVPAVVRLVRAADSLAIREQATGTLWNLSAHPDLKGQLLELGLEPLVNMIIIPYAESLASGGKGGHVEMLDLFTNAAGVVRNLSSTASPESRRRLRDCPELVRSLLTVIQVNYETGMVSSKATENCICVLRNLTYRLQDETPNYQELYMLDGPSEEPTDSSFFCFGKSKPKTITPDYGDQLPENDGNAEGSTILWQPEVAQSYCKLLGDSQKHLEITEATLGAIQNLTSGVWKWAVYARAVIRKEKGLPTIIDRMRTDKDRIVRAGTIALTNLAEDSKNKELIGKFAMKDLVYKLPGGNDPNIHHSDTTVIAVLNTIRVLVERNPENVKHLRESAGIERITTINKKDNSPYQMRVVKAAGQVLQAIWANKEVHSLLKKDGWNKNHFQPTVNIEATLPRRKVAGGAGYATSSSPSMASNTGGRRAQRSGHPSGNNTLASNSGGGGTLRRTGAAGGTADSWV